MKKAAMRYADLLETGCFITHQEQDEIAKLLRRLVMVDDPEEEAWQELEAKLAKPKKPTNDKKGWKGLDNKDFQYQTPHDVITMKYAEAILKEKNT